MNNKIKMLKELISYGIFGVLTTIINIVVFFLLDKLLIPYTISTVIAWFISVLFAFYTNKKYVFKSNENSTQAISKEIITFYSSRILSLLIDLGLMSLLINLLGINHLISKLLSNIVVIVINYILSKFFIFKKN